MGFIEAAVLFVVGLTAFICLLPAMTELLEPIKTSMGSQVLIACGSLIVITLVAIVVAYFRNLTNDEQSYGNVFK